MQFRSSQFSGLSRLFAALAVVCLIPAAANAGTVTSDGPDLIIKTKGGLEVKTADEKYSFKVGGGIQLDYTDFDGIFNRTEDGDSGSDFDFRRIRISLSGKVASDWKYKFEYDFEGDGKTTDVFFDYTGFGKMTIVSLGKFKVPFGMDELTSSKDFLGIERNALNQKPFIPSRLNGVALSGSNDVYQYRVGAFKGGTGDNKEIDWTVGARFTFTPIRANDMVVHLGVAWMQSDFDNNSAEPEVVAPALGDLPGSTRSFKGTQVAFTPEVHGGAEKFASPEASYDKYNGLALEVAGTMGQLFYQIEYREMEFEGDDINTQFDATGALDGANPVNVNTGVDIEGYSAQAAWVLTGETRPYKGGGGVFGSIKPKGPGGAWEVFARYTSIDMDDTDNQRETGFDDAESTTVGVNWYPNAQVRVSFNWVSGEGDARHPDEKHDDGDAMIARLQYRF